MSALDNIRLTREPVDILEKGMLNHCVCHKISYLAAMILEEEHELTVCQSDAGFYLGCQDDSGPVSRDSGYYPTAEAAQEALDNRSWEQRLDA